MPLVNEQLKRYPPRLELVGGPMDGDHRSTWAEELYFTSAEDGYVHYYLKLDNDFYWQGLIPYRRDMKIVLQLDPGKKT